MALQPVRPNAVMIVSAASDFSFIRDSLMVNDVEKRIDFKILCVTFKNEFYSKRKYFQGVKHGIFV